MTPCRSEGRLRAHKMSQGDGFALVAMGGRKGSQKAVDEGVDLRWFEIWATIPGHFSASFLCKLR